MRVIVNKEAFSMHMLIRESLILGAILAKKQMMSKQIDFNRFLQSDEVGIVTLLKDRINTNMEDR